jgi:hypothetical protein
MLLNSCYPKNLFLQDVVTGRILQSYQLQDLSGIQQDLIQD